MDFDRRTLVAAWALVVVWVIGALASLGLAGVIIWAIVRAVTKYL